MKKNLISIAILALLVVNIVLTSIMMINVTSTNKKTAALVSDIAAAVELDLSAGQIEEEIVVPLENTVTYTIPDLTILLKKSTVINEQGAEVKAEKDHYALVSVTLSMNSEHEDYGTYGTDLTSREDLIKGVINSVIRNYSLEEASANPQAIEDELLKEIQKLFGSDFVFDVTLPKWLPQ